MLESIERRGSAVLALACDPFLRVSFLRRPTASPWAAHLFVRGVDVLGGISRPTDLSCWKLLRQGDSGYFFGQGAEKVCFVRGAE